MTAETQDKNAETAMDAEEQKTASETTDTAEAEHPDMPSPDAEALGSADTSEEADDIHVLKDQLLRVMADNENLRKRTERDMAAAKKYGALGLARDLLASIDNLETAMSHMPENKEDMDETLKISYRGRDVGTGICHCSGTASDHKTHPRGREI